MTMRFTVLASGSAGNASLVQVDGCGVLIDVGLGPRQLAARLAECGAGWDDVHAVLLTHTHGDHWHESTLKHLQRRGIRLWCHDGHQAALHNASRHFHQLSACGLVQTFEPGQPMDLGAGLTAHAVRLAHDASATFGFRLELLNDEDDCLAALAYAADLGSWTSQVAGLLTNADIVALEFNHDVAMQHASGRPFHLIRRILGDRGHLSNAQAAALLRAALRQSAFGRLRHVVLLHLSEECNRPELALAAAETAVQGHEVRVHAAHQDAPLPAVATGSGWRRRSYGPRRALSCTGWLPGMEP